MRMLRSVSCLGIGAACAALAACATSGTVPIDDAPSIEHDSGSGTDGATSDASGAGEAGRDDAGRDDAGHIPDDAAAMDAAHVDVRFADVITPDSAVGSTIEIPPRPGDKTTSVVTLPASPQLPRLTLNSCSGGSLGFSSSTSFAYVTLHNSDPAHDAIVSVWTSRTSGGPVVDTLIAAYASPTPPRSEPERLACSVGVQKRCYVTGGDGSACLSESGGRAWAGLMDGDRNGVAVPAGGTAVVYMASYDSSGAGDVLVTVRTEALR